MSPRGTDGKQPGNKKDAFRRSVSNSYAGRPEPGTFALMPEQAFKKVLLTEKRRSERSGQRFVLMLLHTGKLLQSERGEECITAITTTLSTSIRETDISGWYERPSAIGVICTEIGSENLNSAISTLHSRLFAVLRNSLSLEEINLLHISFHVFPDDLDLEATGRAADARLYPELNPPDSATKAFRMIKRTMDVMGSACALLILSPVLVLIAVAVKLTSEGPILYKQQRLGKHGARFTFLKFRSMYVQNDSNIHRDFVKRLISGKQDQQSPEPSEGIYKIRNDPRVTRIGKFLRKTSLDELPQFFNVLKGDMSLVGPRPPIPYEVEAYDIWHRRRFLEVQPGITGLWQVEGRSRTKFDDMVRLDLKYARTWSPWLDIKILLRTPSAVFRGDGAY